MDIVLFIEQILNGLQLGVLLFLLAAGLTLVFGIMNFINLAHGSIYMIGAFIAAYLTRLTESFALGILLALPAVVFFALVLERLVLRKLYERDHLDQVLATFGLILFFNEGIRLIWGSGGVAIELPTYLDGSTVLGSNLVISTYRLVIVCVGLVVAISLYGLVTYTRLGMLIRAGASNRRMVGLLGVNVDVLFAIVFSIGAMLAGLAGMLIAPIGQAQVGMGEQVLILCFVVIVIGGIGSIRGAFIAAILIGFIDTMGRAYFDVLLLKILTVNAAETAGPALSSMGVYLLMAGILVFRPRGLFPAEGVK